MVYNDKKERATDLNPRAFRHYTGHRILEARPAEGSVCCTWHKKRDSETQRTFMLCSVRDGRRHRVKIACFGLTQRVRRTAAPLRAQISGHLLKLPDARRASSRLAFYKTGGSSWRSLWQMSDPSSGLYDALVPRYVVGWALIWRAFRSTHRWTQPARAAVRSRRTSGDFTTRSTCCSATRRESSSSTVSMCTTPSATSTTWSKLSEWFSTRPANDSCCPCSAWSSRGPTSCCSTSTRPRDSTWRRTCSPATAARRALERRATQPCRSMSAPSTCSPPSPPPVRTGSPPAQSCQPPWDCRSLRALLERCAKSPWRAPGATRVWVSASAGDRSTAWGSTCPWWSRARRPRGRDWGSGTRSWRWTTSCLKMWLT